MKAMDEEVLALLERPENLPVALELQGWVTTLQVSTDAPPAARELLANADYHATACEIARLLAHSHERIYGRFWNYVRSLLDTKLDRRPDRAHWRTDLSSEYGASNTHLSILPADGEIEGTAQICAESLGGKCWFGIFVCNRSAATRGIEESLRQEKFRPNKWWAGYRYFRDLGLSALGGQPADMLRLNADNHTPARPLATTVANLLWDLFDRYAKQVEALHAGTAKHRAQ